MSLYLARESTWAPFTTCSGGWWTAAAIVCSAGRSAMAAGRGSVSAPGGFGLAPTAACSVGGRAAGAARGVAGEQRGVQSVCEVAESLAWRAAHLLASPGAGLRRAAKLGGGDHSLAVQSRLHGPRQCCGEAQNAGGPSRSLLSGPPRRDSTAGWSPSAGLTEDGWAGMLRCPAHSAELLEGRVPGGAPPTTHTP